MSSKSKPSIKQGAGRRILRCDTLSIGMPASVTNIFYCSRSDGKDLIGAPEHSSTHKNLVTTESEEIERIEEVAKEIAREEPSDVTVPLPEEPEPPDGRGNTQQPLDPVPPDDDPLGFVEEVLMPGRTKIHLTLADGNFDASTPRTTDRMVRHHADATVLGQELEEAEEVDQDAGSNVGNPDDAGLMAFFNGDETENPFPNTTAVGVNTDNESLMSETFVKVTIRMLWEMIREVNTDQGKEYRFLVFSEEVFRDCMNSQRQTQLTEVIMNRRRAEQADQNLRQWATRLVDDLPDLLYGGDFLIPGSLQVNRLNLLVRNLVGDMDGYLPSDEWTRHVINAVNIIQKKDKDFVRIVKSFEDRLVKELFPCDNKAKAVRFDYTNYKIVSTRGDNFERYDLPKMFRLLMNSAVQVEANVGNSKGWYDSLSPSFILSSELHNKIVSSWKSSPTRGTAVSLQGDIKRLTSHVRNEICPRIQALIEETPLSLRTLANMLDVPIKLFRNWRELNQEFATTNAGDEKIFEEVYVFYQKAIALQDATERGGSTLFRFMSELYGISRIVEKPPNESPQSDDDGEIRRGRTREGRNRTFEEDRTDAGYSLNIHDDPGRTRDRNNGATGARRGRDESSDRESDRESVLSNISRKSAKQREKNQDKLKKLLGVISATLESAISKLDQFDPENDSKQELTVTKTNLDDLRKDLLKFIGECEIPPISVNGFFVDPVEKLEKTLTKILVLQEQAEEVKSQKKKDLEHKRNILSKSMPAMTFPKLVNHCDYLVWHHRMKGIMADQNFDDGDQHLLSNIRNSVDSRYDAVIGKDKTSVTELIKTIIGYFSPKAVDYWIEQKAKKMTSPGDDLKIALDNVSEILQSITLMESSLTHNQITDNHLTILELKAFDSREIQSYRDLIVKLSRSRDKDGFIDHVKHVIDGGGSVGDCAALNVEDRADRTFFGNLKEDRGNKVSTDVFNFGKQDLAKPEHKLKILFIFGTNYMSKLKMSQALVINHKKAENSVHLMNEMHYNSRKPRRFEKERRRGPQLPCPLVGHCEEKNKPCIQSYGSAFNCPTLRREGMELSEREAMVKKNNLCRLCLRPAHKEGECTMTKHKCYHCGEIGVHSALLCPQRPEFQKLAQQVHVTIEQVDDQYSGEESMDEEWEDSQWEQGLRSQTCMMMTVNIETESLYERFKDSLVRETNFVENEPEMSEEKAEKIREAVHYVLERSKESEKTGLTLKQRTEAAKGHCMMMSEQVKKDGSLQHIPENIREDLKRVSLSSKASNIKQGDLRSWLSVLQSGGFPGIDPYQRTPQEREELRIGPQTKGELGGLYKKLYKQSVHCYNFGNGGPGYLQVIQIAIKIEDDNLFPGDVTELEDAFITRDDGDRVLVVNALLDTGANMSMSSRALLNELQPQRIRQHSASISTGNGTIDLLDSLYCYTVKTRGANQTVTSTVLTSPLNRQWGFDLVSRRIIVEEFKMSKQAEDLVYWRGFVKPHVLIGVREGHGLVEIVSPTSLGLRPKIINPHVHIGTSDLSWSGGQQYFVFGSLGSPPESYDWKGNTPAFFLQPENLTRKRLMKWQEFSEILLAELDQERKDTVYYNQSYICQTVRDQLTEQGVPQPFQDHVKGSYLHVQEMVKSHSSIESTGEEMTKTLDEQHLTVQNCKQIEAFIESESKFWVPDPVCKNHRRVMEETKKTCPDCQVAGDDDAARRARLRDQIDKQLYTVKDPRTGKFVFVQTLVWSEDRHLLGHTSCNNSQTSYKSSVRVVNKTKSNLHHLRTLDDQNFTYLRLDKYRILEAEDLRRIAEGEIPAAFFSRNFVSKPDRCYKIQISVSVSDCVIVLSVSTPVRLISDTSRPAFNTGCSLAKSNPAARGFTPSLFKVVLRCVKRTLTLTVLIVNIYLRFFVGESYVALDVSKVEDIGEALYVCNTQSFQAYHSVRLDPQDMYMFLSIWFNDVVKEGIKFPYVTANAMIDFGMPECVRVVLRITGGHITGFGAAHHSLELACLRTVPEMKLETSKKSLESDLFVDNIGIRQMRKNHEDSQAQVDDIISTFSEFTLKIDKCYGAKDDVPAGKLRDAMPESVIMFGLVWSDSLRSCVRTDLHVVDRFLEEDLVLPRIKLDLYGNSRGASLGGDISKLNLSEETMTKRRHIRLLSSLYCLTGANTNIMNTNTHTHHLFSKGRFAAYPISQGKHLLRRIVMECREAVSLDYDIKMSNPDLDRDIKAFWSQMRNFQDDLIKFPRSALVPGAALDSLVFLHDASPTCLGTTCYLVSRTAKGKYSNILAAKSSMTRGSAPRNEKLSILQSLALANQIVDSLASDLAEVADLRLYFLGDSTIASYIFAPETDKEESKKDGNSIAVAAKCLAHISTLGTRLPEAELILAWVPGSTLSSADALTKPSTRDPVSFSNSSSWRSGSKTLYDSDLLEKFVYLRHSTASGTKYVQLPDHLRRDTGHNLALLLHEVQLLKPDQFNLVLKNVSAGLPPGPQDLINLWLLPSQGMYLATTCKPISDPSDKTITRQLAQLYLMTRLRTKQRAEAFASDLNDQAGPARISSVTSGMERLTKNKVSPSRLTEFSYSLPKLTDLAGKRVKISINVRDGLQTTLRRLNHSCYDDSKNLLRYWTPEIPQLADFACKNDYLTALETKEFLHCAINVQTFVYRMVNNEKRKNMQDLTVGLWLKFLRADQKFYKPSPADNYHQGLGLYFSRPVLNDPVTNNLLGLPNLPLISSDGPLILKLIASTHKEPGKDRLSWVHNPPGRTRSRLVTGMFGVMSPGLKDNIRKILLDCAGCLRSKKVYFKSLIGPRITKTSLETGLFDQVSFDEIFVGLVHSPKSRVANYRVTVWLFCCHQSGATINCLTDSNDSNGLRKALAHFVCKTGVTPSHYFCDNFSTHRSLAKDNKGIQTYGEFTVLPSHSQHRNAVERKVSIHSGLISVFSIVFSKVKDFKSILRSISRVSKDEGSGFKNFTVTELQMTLDKICHVLNSSPIKAEESHLTPLHLMSPVLTNAALIDCDYEAADWRITTAGNRALQTVWNAIRNERAKIMAGVQAEYEKKHYKTKKGQNKGEELQIGDIVLVDFRDNAAHRMGLVMKITDNKTTAEVRVGNKTFTEPVKNLRCLSVYRPREKYECCMIELCKAATLHCYIRNM